MSTKEQKEHIELLLHGTLDSLILRALRRPAHRQAVGDAIEFNSDDVCPALHRLVKRGWVSAEERTSGNNRRAKFYQLKAEGDGDRMSKPAKGTS